VSAWCVPRCLPRRLEPPGLQGCSAGTPPVPVSGRQPLVGYVLHASGGFVVRPGEDLVDALPGDVEDAGEFALALSCLVCCEHGLTEVLPGSVEALEGLVGDPKATGDFADFRLVAHLERILMQEYVPLPGRRSRFLGRPAQSNLGGDGGAA